MIKNARAMPEAEYSPALRQAVDRARPILRIRDLRPGQAEVIESVLSGRDTLAIMPTGSGKSLTYQLPALSLPGPTLVVSPLLALIEDSSAGDAGRREVLALLRGRGSLRVPVGP